MARSDIAVWDVVKVPFPYTNRDVTQRRPALVIADHLDDGMPHLVWVLMITSAANRSWPSDIGVADLRSAGLPAPSVIRPTKITTVEAGTVAKAGRLAPPDRKAVESFFADTFGRLA